ncbi:DeoR/GlpR family DNA-binding transcription regulator [Thalassovita aquimarina]|uniref:DeoR/GlpR family DNA-binding transcription regulator n=1 Tax=Thalassovita aquimarina TaxID=2785917 RepID=UPI003565FEAF
MQDQNTTSPATPRRLRKSERREQILLELRLAPHVRISELAEQFGVTTETIRRDVEDMSREGLLSRAHGGASAAPVGAMQNFDERSRDRVEERSRIGRHAAAMVRPGEVIFIDAGATTLQLARFLAFNGTPVTAITNSLQVAMALGQSSATRVIMCPGDYLPAESAVTGTDAIEFIGRHNADQTFIGASGISERGVSEAVPGFAAVKRAMMRQSPQTHLLIDGNKFGQDCLDIIERPAAFRTVIADRAPEKALKQALVGAGVTISVAG